MIIGHFTFGTCTITHIYIVQALKHNVFKKLLFKKTSLDKTKTKINKILGFLTYMFESKNSYDEIFKY